MQKLIKQIAKQYNISVKFNKNGKLNKKSLQLFKDYVDWDSISFYQSLSEEFIREFKDYVNWNHISIHQTLSEEFIRKFKDKVYWNHISKYKTLSAEFIREFKDNVDWTYISIYQTLSEEFIREFKDKVNWEYISRYQTLSEDFIREFKDNVYWYYISIHQTLSEEFIREFKDKVNWYYISMYQKLSLSFRKEFNIEVSSSCWLYKSTKKKLEYIKEHTNYEVIDDKYVIAYKSVRNNMSSVFKPSIKYEIGKTYHSHCDCNVDEENSFGLSAWTKEKAKEYHDEILLKVKISISKIGAIVHDDQKIRCFEQKILTRIIAADV
jgi:phosphoribosylanthranilate isomerase